MGSSHRDRCLPRAGLDRVSCIFVFNPSDGHCKETHRFWRFLLSAWVCECVYRILIGVPNNTRVAGLFVAYLVSYKTFRESGRPSIDAVDYLILQQVMLAYGLMSATIPCLKSFLGRFRTGDLAKLTESEVMESYNLRENSSTSRSRSHGQSLALTSMDRRGGVGQGKRAKTQLPAMLRPDDTYHTTQAYAQRSSDNGSGSNRSSGSQQMIIHRRVDFDVVSR